MRIDKLQKKTASFLLSFGMIASQLPVYADQTTETATAPLDDAPAQVAQVPAITPTAPVKVRATEQVGGPDNSVLAGHIESNVDNLTKDILRDEVKLQRFNLMYRINAAKQGRWKGWRYFVGQEGSLACTEASIITTIAERGDHLRSGEKGEHSFSKNSRNLVANGGLLPGGIGNCVALGADMLELGINEWHAIEAQNHGYGSKDARAHAIQLVAEIDRKLAAREKLIKELPAADREIGEMQDDEGAVLQDFRDLAIAEFERYHASAKKTLVQQNSFYVLDGLRNVCGAMATFSAMYITTHKRPRYVADFVIWAEIQGGLTIFDPILSRIAGKMALKADQRNNPKAGLPTIYEHEEKLDKDYDRLNSFCTNHQVKDRPEMASAVARLDAFNASHAFVTGEIQRNASALRKGNRTAVQNMGVATFVGLSRIAQASTIAAYSANGRNPHSYIGNALVFAGNIEYLPSITTALIDNLRINMGNEFRRSRLKKQHALPGQIVNDRLQKLNEIEKRI